VRFFFCCFRCPMGLPCSGDLDFFVILPLPPLRTFSFIVSRMELQRNGSGFCCFIRRRSQKIVTHTPNTPPRWFSMGFFLLFLSVILVRRRDFPSRTSPCSLPLPVSCGRLFMVQHIPPKSTSVVFALLLFFSFLLSSASLCRPSLVRSFQFHPSSSAW